MIKKTAIVASILTGLLTGNIESENKAYSQDIFYKPFEVGVPKNESSLDSLVNDGHVKNPYSQINISFFPSLTLFQAGKSGPLTDLISLGGSISYEFTKLLGKNFDTPVGVRLQARSEEIWHKQSKGSKAIPMPSASIHVYISSFENKHSVNPMAGAYVGLGFPSKRQRKKELTKEKGYFRHPYFGGVFFQMNYKFHTTIATYASLFLRFEAGGAKYGGKPLDVEVSNKKKVLVTY